MKSLSENLTTEVESYKDLIWAKDKALEVGNISGFCDVVYTVLYCR